MMQSFTLLVAALLLAGCATTGGTSTRPTAASLPLAEIEAQYSPELQARLGAMQIGGWVIMEGTIRDDGSVSIHKLVASHPDDSANDLARKFAKKVVINMQTTGSHMASLARVHVVFYGRGFDERVAVIYARPINRSSSSGTGDASFLEAITH